MPHVHTRLRRHIVWLRHIAPAASRPRCILLQTARFQDAQSLSICSSAQQASCFQVYESACQAPWQPVASMMPPAWCVCAWLLQSLVSTGLEVGGSGRCADVCWWLGCSSCLIGSAAKLSCFQTYTWELLYACNSLLIWARLKLGTWGGTHVRQKVRVGDSSVCVSFWFASLFICWIKRKSSIWENDYRRSNSFDYVNCRED